MDEGIAIIVAAAAAIAGIFLTSRQQRRLYRREHTHKVLDKLYDWSDFNKNWTSAVSFLSRGEPLSLSDSPATSRDAIDFILNYYEFVAGSIVSGDLDESLIRRVEEHRMCRIYLRNLTYVDAIREHYGTNTSWEHLEFICYRWKIVHQDIFDNIYYWITGRPPMGPFMGRRKEIKEEIERFATEQLPPMSIIIKEPHKASETEWGRLSSILRDLSEILAKLQ